MNKTQAPLSTRGRWLAGLAIIAFGLFLILATWDVGPLGTADINGPAWLGLALGGAIAACGLALIVGQERPLLNGALAILVLLGLAAVGNWIAFGVGERACSGSILFWSDNDYAGLACRVPFGIGSVILNTIILLAFVTLLQKALGGPPRLSRLVSLAENLMFLSLSPILLPMFLLLFIRIAFGAIRTRLSTGSWPRNEKFIARLHTKKNREP